MATIVVRREHLHLYAFALTFIIALAVLLAFTLKDHKPLPRIEGTGRGAPAAIEPLPR